jgi:hypothetical protein
MRPFAPVGATPFVFLRRLLCFHCHSTCHRPFTFRKALVIGDNGKDFATVVELVVVIIADAPMEVHNQIVICGAPKVLTRCLARSLATKERMVEVGPICRLIEILLRCSKYVATQSVQDIAHELYPLLLAILLLEKVLFEWQTPYPTKRLIERVSSFPIKLQESSNTNHLLRSLHEAILISISSSTIKREHLYGIFRMLTGLTLHEESRRQLMHSPGLFDDIVANFSSLRVISSHVATFLLVVAQDAAIKRKMVDSPDFIHVLSKLLLEEGAQTRKVAIALLKLVAADIGGRTKLIAIGGNSFFDSLFECTKKNETQEACFESIRYLICPDTAQSIYSNEKLINSMLKEKIFLSPSCSQTGVLAAKVINRLSSFLAVNGMGMERFLDTILQISSSKHNRIRYWGAKALLKQSQSEACRFFLMRTSPVVRTITKLATDENPHVHATAMNILSNLASFSLNQKLLARNQAILSSLTTTVEDSRASFGEAAKRDAVVAFLHLANNKTISTVIAKQHNVVASLSKYGVSSSGEDKEMMQAALHCVICLTPHM